jgi:phospholipase/carboxylesterase
MNRLHAPSISLGPHFHPVASDLSAGKVESGDESHPYSLFAPLHYEANYGYPLLVWLHGGADSQRQLRRLMPLVSMRNYVAVAPRGTLEISESDGSAAGCSWHQSHDHVAQADHAIHVAIAAAQDRFNIRPDRIFLAGYQSGGTMALRIATEQADRFAGVVSLCGPFPTHGAPLAKVNNVRQLPVFLAGCRGGSHYTTVQLCDNLRLFHAAGINSISVREYPGPDSLNEHMLAEVDRWMMDQITGATAIAGGIPPRQTGVG